MIISLTIIRYPKVFVPVAFFAMAIHRLPLFLNRRCSFWKLMGSGNKGTFDLKPDLRQWALLAVWQSRNDFEEFYHHSFISWWWKIFSTEQWTILCTPLTSHGKWDGINPFAGESKEVYTGGPIAVLTRATIRPSRLKSFWSNADHVADILRRSQGYIVSFGIGEVPFFKQATFSVWKSAEDVKAFAYQSEEHREVINKTRSGNWYSEELFARFIPIESFGSLHGSDPLKDLV